MTVHVGDLVGGTGARIAASTVTLFREEYMRVWDPNSLEADVELLKHRLMPRSVNPGDEAWLMQRWGLKSVNIGLWSEATHKHCAMAPAPPLETVRKATAIHQALRLCNYTSDEIDACPKAYKTTKAWGRVLHEAGVGNLVTMSPVPDCPTARAPAARRLTCGFCYPPCTTPPRTASRRCCAKAMRSGRTTHWSRMATRPNGPSTSRRSMSASSRVSSAKSLHLTGLLYWRVDLWTSDPWTDVQTYRANGNDYPGEGMLVYPGKPVGVTGVVPSMRLKWLRDGVKDYEYIEI